MSFPILFGGLWLVAFALSWPIQIYSISVLAQHAETGKVDLGPFGQPLSRLAWSFVFALGATLYRFGGAP